MSSRRFRRSGAACYQRVLSPAPDGLGCSAAPRMFRTRGLIGFTLMLFMTASILVAQNSRGRITELTRPLTASVVGTFFLQPNEIELLILWRGAPSWFSGTEQNHVSDSGSTRRLHLEYGAVRLDLTYDRGRRIVKIGNTEISLANGKNILMVDGVGTSKLVPTTLAADLSFASANPELATILRRSPEVVAFLRCEQVDPDPALRAAAQRLNAIICDGLTPPR